MLVWHSITTTFAAMTWFGEGHVHICCRCGFLAELAAEKLVFHRAPSAKYALLIEVVEQGVFQPLIMERGGIRPFHCKVTGKCLPAITTALTVHEDFPSKKRATHENPSVVELSRSNHVTKQRHGK